MFLHYMQYRICPGQQIFGNFQWLAANEITYVLTSTVDFRTYVVIGMMNDVDAPAQSGRCRSTARVSRLVTEQRWRVNVDGSRHVDLGVVSDSSMRCTVVSVCTCIMPTQFHCQ